MQTIISIVAAWLAFAEIGYPVSVPSTHSRNTNDSRIRTIHQFPNETWLENLAVRDDGQILVTLITTSEVWEVDPFTSSAEHIYTFPNASSACGIVETQANVFAVAVGNWSTTNFTSSPGSYSVWKMDFGDKATYPWARWSGEQQQPRVSKIADIPEASFLNGMTTPSQQNRDVVLISDSLNGVIWQFDTSNGNYSLWLDDPAFKPNKTAAAVLGVNGIQTYDGYVYFANSFSEPALGRIPITTAGQPAGPVEVVVNRGTYAANLSYSADDFTFDKQGDTYIAADPSNILVKVTPSGKASVVLGALNDPVIAGDTAAKFGRTKWDEKTLYITTNGGIANPSSAGIQGGKIVAFDVEG